MKGQISIYTVNEDDSKTLFYESENMIVDGAKESIVDILTYTTPDASTIPSVSATALRNNSNFTIGAFSLGPSRWDLNKSLAKGTAGFKGAVSGNANRFPEFPKPEDKTLQPIDASNHLGHHLNYIEFSGHVNGVRSLPAADASGYTVFYGSYAPGSGGSALPEGGYLNSRSVTDKYGFIYRNPEVNFKFTNVSGGDLNTALVQASCVSGFGVSSDNAAGTGVNPSRYLTSGDAFATFVLCLHKGDVDWLREKYGGIDAIGLWTWDYDENLRTIGLPGGDGTFASEAWVPYGQGRSGGSGGKYSTSLYNFENLTKFPQFKLFAKRILFPDGLQVPTHETSYKFMLIEWKITFA